MEEFKTNCKACGKEIFDRSVRRGDSWVKQDWCDRVCESNLQQEDRVFYKQTQAGVTLNEDHSNFIKKDDMHHPSRIEEHNKDVQNRTMNYFSQQKQTQE